MLTKYAAVLRVLQHVAAAAGQREGAGAEPAAVCAAAGGWRAVLLVPQQSVAGAGAGAAGRCGAGEGALQGQHRQLA